MRGGSVTKNGYRNTRQNDGFETRMKMTVGRPKLRWMGGVAEDLRKLGIEIWWIVTRERVMEESSTASRGS
jgi:hypothetical protein